MIKVRINTVLTRILLIPFYIDFIFIVIPIFFINELISKLLWTLKKKK